MENEYDIYRPFDAEKHKAKYSNYLEVLILEDGTVVYAIPSHQEKAIALACEKHGLSRDELVAMCPREYYLDYMVWLLKMSGAIAVWTSGCNREADHRSEKAQDYGPIQRLDSEDCRRRRRRINEWALSRKLLILFPFRCMIQKMQHRTEVYQ